MDNNRSSFSGAVGFVLAAAGSAVGLGNIWRFPYLAAKDGGGLFLVIYLILAVTFGFALLTTEIAIGRKTRQSPLTAYTKLSKRWSWVGIVACIIPMLILPYYCVIGGWLVKYAVAFIFGHGAEMATDGYFVHFISQDWEPIIYSAIFLLATCFIIYRGVEGGIEFSSKVLMPVLIILIIGISVYSLFLSYEVDNGVVRSGVDGLKVLFVPNVEDLSFNKLSVTLMDAMGQLFFSLSVAMGIMVSYGSYFHKKGNLVKSINRIEIFDTFVAVLAGVMIIPAVYVFMGREGMNASGPGLLFVSMPKIFASMGSAGYVVGALFFLMALFAAITSSVSIFEAIVSSFMDKYLVSREKATFVEFWIALFFAVLVCLGYNKLYFEITLPNGVVAQVLDIMDYISNNILMPIVSIATCVLVGWIVKPKTVVDEVVRNGEKFGRKWLYIVMIKFVAPFMLLLLLLKSFGLM